jgi:CRISPR-associated exonuclease Cas4
MMGSKDLRKIITDSVNEKYIQSREITLDPNRIHADEASRCTRLSYYERVEPINPNTNMLFQHLLSHGLRHLFENVESEYKIDNLTLVVSADMILEEELVVRVQVSDSLPRAPKPQDLLYLNACLYAFNKAEGILIYIQADGKTSEFVVTKSNKMFEELIRKARVLTTLLKENRVPIVEPSESCITCKYYERCYIMERRESSFSIESLFGKSKNEAKH